MNTSFSFKGLRHTTVELAQGNVRCIEKVVNTFSPQINKLSQEVHDLPNGVTKIFANAIMDTINKENKKYQAFLSRGKEIYSIERIYNHMEQEAKIRNIINNAIKDLKNILHNKR